MRTTGRRLPIVLVPHSYQFYRFVVVIFVGARLHLAKFLLPGNVIYCMNKSHLPCNAEKNRYVIFKRTCLK